MTDKPFHLDLSDLRRRAEESARASVAEPQEALSSGEARRLVHELQVYQIELEMQNDELRRAEAAAREASARYGEPFDFAPIAYFLWDHEGRILEVNLAGAALLGLDRGAVIHKRFGQFVAMDDHARFSDFCHQALQVDAKRTCEVKILKGGQTVNVLVEGTAAQGPHAQGGLCRAAVIDITERTQMGKLLLANVERYRQLVEQMVDGIFVATREGRYVDVNPAGCQLFGMTREEVLASSLTDVLMPDEYHRLPATVASFANGEVHRSEWRFRRKDGSVLIGELAGRQLPDGRLQGIVHDITERKQGEEALRKSEERYRSLFDQMTEGFALHEIICDEHGTPCDYRFLDVNPAFEHLTGLKRTNLIGKTMREVLPDEKQEWIKAYGAVALNGQSVRFENYSEGLGRYYDVFAYCPAPRQFAVIFSDVSKRRRVEVALQRSEASLADAQRIAHIGSWEWDVHANTAQWSEETLQLFGVSLGDLKNHREEFLDRIHPGDRARVDQALSDALSGTRHYDLTYRILLPDNSEKIIHALAEVIRDGAGNPVLMRGTVHDISEREQATRRLRESEERFRILFEESPDGILIIDPASARFVEFNTAAHQQLGYSRQEFAQLGIMDVEAVETAEEIKERIAGITRQGKVDFETLQRTRQGEIRNVHVTAQLVDVLDRPVYQCIWRDITDRKRAEQEKLEMERRLFHAQKLESIGVLAGGIAHDFNNILAGIMGYADLALGGLLPAEPVREDIEVIKKAVQRAADLTRQMLAYAGKGKFFVESVDLAPCVRDLSRMLEVSISKKATLKHNLLPDLPVIQADASQINQVIMNLIVNASEALGEQGGLISISVDAVQCSTEDLAGIGFGQDLAEGLYVRLKVADTGCGMDRQTLAKIFDPFFTTKFMGRGLGLAAVQGIVRGHKGAIRVDSEPGQGTTFQVFFPASGPPAAPAQRESVAASMRSSGTIMVVDDEETVRTLAQRMLEHAGFSALTASGGREAIQIFREHQQEVACVLLDLTMPDLDGAETFHELRRIRPDVRVILTSGYNEEIATERFSGQGLAGFIQKPYQLDTMIATLRQAVSGRSKEEGRPN